MKTIKEIEVETKELIEQIEGEDAVEEVMALYPAYEANKEILLKSESIEDYLEKYDEICRDEKAVLECFDSSEASELKAYIQENSITLDRLKLETHNATCEALKFLIYEAEDEEY